VKRINKVDMNEITSKITKQELVKWRALKWLQNSNLKDIPTDALGKLKRSLIENDFIQPFNVWQDAKGTIWILDGHHREKALKELEAEGYTIPEELPANFVQCNSKKDAAKLVLVYSSIYARVTDQGLFDFLSDFDLKLTDLDSIDLPTLDLDKFEMKHFPKTDEEKLDSVPETLTETYTEAGDIFLIDGKHRVMCGDSCNAADVALLMDGKHADMVFTDPPYGVDYQSNMRTATPKFEVLKNDNKFITGWIEFCKEYNHGFIFVWTSWKVLIEWMAALSVLGELSNMIIWFKRGGGMGSLKDTYLTDYEICLVYNNNSELKGKRIGSVWDVNKDNVSTYQHPTQKPVELCNLAINTTTNPNETILDLFLGSGSTLIAAEQTNRVCYGMEIEPKYIDVILRRYKKTYPAAKFECLTRQYPFEEVFNA